MRRSLLFIFIIILASAWTWAIKVTYPPPEKTYSVSLPLSKWVEITNRLEAVKDVVRQSDVQARQSTFICDSILTALQSTIGKQVQDQLNAEMKKDTSKPKK